MKLPIVGAAAIVSTLAGSYAATLLTVDSKGPAKNEPPSLEMIKLDVISVPVIRSGEIQGYVLARTAVEVPVEDAKKNRAAIALYSAEGVFRAIHEEGYDFAALKPADIPRIADRTTKLINERIGRSAVSGTIIESVNFVLQSEVRAPLNSRRAAAQQR